MDGPRPTEIDLPAPVVDEKVARGRDGWLFLDNDPNRVMAQHSGALRYSDEQLRHWRFLLETRIVWVERQGARYHTLVAPDPHAVYPEKLPEAAQPASERPIHQLLRELERSGSFARLVYPLEQLQRQKSRPVFPKTDTHWSELGAFVAYRKLLGEVAEGVPAPVLSQEDVAESEVQRWGDLGSKLDPRQSSTFVYLDVRQPRSRLVYDNRVQRRGRRVEFAGDRSDLDCLVFGDSCAVRVVPFVAESFRRLVYVHMRTLDHELVRRERPDVVVNMISERFMIDVPVDLPAPTWAEIEQRKRSRGELMRPRPEIATNRLNEAR